MVQFYDSIPSHLQEWVLSQSIFFTASAPLHGTHVNVSPKGLPASTFSIFNPNRAAYIDATGSGSETISHIYENGRVTIMFCSFEKNPRILRFFCWGEVVEWDNPRFEKLLSSMGKRRVDGARAVILLDIWKVQTSCGYGVPFLSTTPTTSTSPESPNSNTVTQNLPPLPQPNLSDRDTMGHWARNKISTNTLLEYQATNNTRSLYGCPGMRSAIRESGERVRRVWAQRGGAVLGVLVGMVLMWLLGWVQEVFGRWQEGWL